MDLETFIAETLRQIAKGVYTAQLWDDPRNGDCTGARINPQTVGNRPGGTKTFVGERIQQIEFDVAVTVSEEHGKKGGIGVAIGVLGIGGQANSTAANSSVSRIKFSIPVVLPTTN